MDGEIKAVSVEKRSILFDNGTMENWLNVADNVKFDWVKKGKAEISIREDKVVFVKMKQSDGGGFSKPPFKAPVQQALKYGQSRVDFAEKQKQITRLACLNSALKLFELNKDNLKGLISSTQIIAHAEIFAKYAQDGEVSK
jgi:hypothetical protein